MSSVQNKEIVRRVVDEMWNQKKLEVLDQLIHPDFRSIGPGIGEVRDRNGFLEFTKLFVTTFPDLHADIVEMITEGDCVAKVWKAHGTFDAEYMGAPPNHKFITWSGISVYRFADGKLKEIEWGYDYLSLLQEMGVIPVAASAT